MKLFTSFLMIIYSISMFSVHSHEQKANIQIIPIHSTGMIDVIASDKKNLTITYEVINHDVFIESFINGFKFAKEKMGMQHEEGEGHIRLYINDEHVETLFTGAFIISGLPPGEHTIEVKTVKNDRTPYDDLEAIFEVTI